MLRCSIGALGVIRRAPVLLASACIAALAAPVAALRIALPGIAQRGGLRARASCTGRSTDEGAATMRPQLGARCR